MARHINPSRSTNRTIDAIDRKRERERRILFSKARDHADDLAIRLVQRLIDRHIIETDAASPIQEAIARQLRAPATMDEFDIRLKIANIRTLVQDPNILSLYITAYIIEDLIDNPHIQDIYGEDLDVYRAVDSVLNSIRPR